jgi:hypothetical protein
MVEAKEFKNAPMCVYEDPVKDKNPKGGKKVRHQKCKLLSWAKAPSNLLEPFGVSEIDVKHLC